MGFSFSFLHLHFICGRQSNLAYQRRAVCLKNAAVLMLNAGAQTNCKSFDVHDLLT